MLLRCARQLAGIAPEGSFSGLLRGYRQISTGPGCFQKRGGLGDENKDGEGDPDGKPARGKREIISDEEIAQTPFIYNFSGVEPDYKACRLSEPVKERIWRSFHDNPEPVTIDRLAKEYRIRKQRVHAIIWLKDIEKQEEAAQGSPLDTDIEEYFARIDGTYEAADGERHVKIRRTSPTIKNSAAEDGEGPDWDELSAKEDEMMLHEFERRMSFNKKQIAGMIKTDIVSRRRPPGGWSYLVEELGEKGKRGKRGGKRFVAEPDGSRRGLNELEKEFLKRESLIPRRKMTAR
ncbi:protein GAMETE CELL DEFECTIVE 1, mitochondrial [Physcomitrium patens]|uniref:Uncharacterized protein n=1 Tax=Physcomitrium patens TaxID=3218 RepID=A9RI60_PHYPA|nr:uncharacterized protein LOC112275473 [Physcomitrium patens]PNR29120.1 hypothetical protein PHYPA_027812 [Physcomitrium patens]|eukprot:XP_024361578.1 uncharacterized protein LOC112275473 [Physcomitrella patens]